MTGRTLKKYLAQRQGKSTPLADDASVFATEPFAITVTGLDAENENTLVAYLNSVGRRDKSLENTTEFSTAEILAALRSIGQAPTA